MSRLHGKVAIVTGGGGGIGSAISARFAAEGARVVVADVDVERAKAVAADVGAAVEPVLLDVTSALSWEHAVDATIEAFGGLHILVNNAGYFRPAPLESATEDDLRRSFEVNQLGPFLGIKAVLGRMPEGGSIVNVSSGAGMYGTPGLAVYASTKFAVRGLTRCAAMELGARAIRVNSVHPGGIDTPMVSRGPESAAAYRALPVPRIGSPEEVAAMVAFLASDESSYCTGAEFVVDGGMGAGPMLAATGTAGRE